MPRWPGKGGKISNKELSEDIIFHWNNRPGAKRDRTQIKFERAMKLYPKRGCIYIHEAYGEIIYVGMGRSWKRSLVSYNREYFIGSIQDITIIFPRLSNMLEIRELENTLIRLLKPKCNKTNYATAIDELEDESSTRLGNIIDSPGEKL